MLKILFHILSVNALALIMKIIGGFLFPRFMTTQAYSEYQTFSLYLSYLPIFSLGLPAGMFVKYGGQTLRSLDKARYKSEFFLLSGILAGFAVLFLIIWLFRPSRMLLYITVCVFPYCMICSFLSLFQTWGEFRKHNLVQLLTACVPLAGSVILLVITNRLEADWFICLFISVYTVLTISVCIETLKWTWSTNVAPILDKSNLDTWKTGLAICVGSYIHVLIHSLDKQIVKMAFDVESFARYSFALSLQSIVTVFITALSQPMYHFLSNGHIGKKDYIVLMRILMMLGALGGMAYYVCSFVVSWILPDYQQSLDIIEIYFMTFPAIAVINCLYINLYKLYRMRKKYVIRLITVLVFSALMNILLINWRWELTSVTLATAMVYYVWLLAEARTFREVGFSLRDGLFLMGYFCVYVSSLYIPGAIMSAVVHFAALFVLCLLVYKREMIFAMMYLIKRKHKSR